MDWRRPEGQQVLKTTEVWGGGGGTATAQVTLEPAPCEHKTCRSLVSLTPGSTAGQKEGDAL